MRKLLIAGLILMGCSLMTGCSEKEDDPIKETDNTENSITIGSSEDTTPSFTDEGGTAQLTFTATSDWRADVQLTRATTDNSWCRVSPESGKAGKAMIDIITEPNTTATARQAVISILCGEAVKQIVVSQEGVKNNGNENNNPDTFADEPYFQTDFWFRTDAQKMGLRGKVKVMRTDIGWTSEDRSEFDEKGNLLRYITYEEDGKIYTITSYTYDDQNRPMTKNVSGEDNKPFDSYTYEYENGEKMIPTNTTWNHAQAIYKGLSAIKRIQDCGGYYQREDLYFIVTAEGNVVVKDSSYVEITIGTLYPNNEPQVYEYPIVYRDGMPYSSFNVTSCEYYVNGMIKTYVANMKQFYAANAAQASDETTQYGESNHVWNAISFNAGENPPSNYGGTLYWATYTYNENGDIVSGKRSYDGTGITNTDTYSNYKYDKHGNWIERHEAIELLWQEGFTDDTKQRAFEYYE